MRRLSYEQKDGIWQAKLLERHVLKEIVQRLWYQARIPMVQIRERIPGKGQLSTPGIPDLIGYIPCRTPMVGPPWETRYAIPIYVEVKRPGGHRREAQIRFIEEAKQKGCAALFAESWKDVRRELDIFGIKLKEID